MNINYHHNGHSTHRSAFFISDEAFILLAGTFGSLIVIITICLLAQYYIHSHRKGKLDDETDTDLEAFRPLLGRTRSESYHTLPSSSHEAFTRDREIRRMVRDEQVRDDIAGVYQISVQRTGSAGSASSASSDSESEDGWRDVTGEEEEEDESSESESESSSDSDEHDRDEVEDRRELMAMRRYALPKRVMILKFSRG